MTKPLAIIVLMLCLLPSIGCNTKTESNSEAVTESEPPASEAAIPEKSSDTGDEEAESSIEESLTPEEVTLIEASWDEVMEQTTSKAGKIVLLDVWSTSCQPCLREFPHLVDLSQKYPDRVVCLSCSTDYVGISSKPPAYCDERVRKFLSQQNAKFDNYLCTDPADEVFLKIDLAAIPAVYLFGTDGELVERFDNDTQKYGDEFTYEEHIIPKLETLLKNSETESE